MNKVIIAGRLTRDPEVRYSQGENSSAIARYTLAVDRRRQRDGEATADFINCVAFGKLGEFAEKYCQTILRCAENAENFSTAMRRELASVRNPNVFTWMKAEKN